MSERSRWVVTAMTAAVVIAGGTSVILRTASGGGAVDAMDAGILILIAAPSLVLSPMTRSWRIWPWICVLAVVGWLPLVGPAGDTSCTDCGFALLIPLNAALVQLILLAVALLSGSARYR